MRSPLSASLLIAVGLAIVASSIAQVHSQTGETPFLSANDRSRWAAMAALVHEQSANIDYPQEFRDPVTNRRTLQSIDRVMHFGDDGQLHSYSSKPPLLVWAYAVVYGVVHLVTGTSVYDMPLWAGRWTMVVAHLLPLAIYWWILLSLLKQKTRTEFGWTVLAFAAVFGTYLTPFAVSVNNHLPGAICASLSLQALLHALKPNGRTLWFIAAGLFTGLGVVCELPALAWAAIVGLLLLLHHPRRTLVFFVPALSFVGVLAICSNYWTHGSWRPPYAHRHLGPLLDQLEGASDEAIALKLPALVTKPEVTPPRGPAQETLEPWLLKHVPESRWSEWQVLPSLRSDHWELRRTDPKSMAIINRIAIVPHAKESQSLEWRLYEWDDWYDHPGTYWTPGKVSGVDRGEPNRAVYAFHVLLGHHGVLTLTPLWIFSLLGLFFWRGPSDALASSEPAGDQQSGRVVLSIALVTFVCVAFYLGRGEVDRNYGGVSCCFRWLLWLVPLWLWMATPAVDHLASNRWGRALVCLSLAISVFGAFSAMSNPWQHPWLYRYADYLGWLANP